jgi:hypothetical protein
LEALPRWENRIRIGPGVFGPASGLPMVRVINALASVHWFYHQIHEIADGREVDTGKGGLAVFLKFYGLDARMAKAYRRQLAADGLALPG